MKTFVRMDLGLGLMAEMALTDQDKDLMALPTDHLFPTCITWALLRDDGIQRDFIFELLRELAPYLSFEAIDGALQGQEGWGMAMPPPPLSTAIAKLQAL